MHSNKIHKVLYISCPQKCCRFFVFFKEAVFCLQVKKIFENEKRLQAGDHSLDLLALDFEKNYNMYVFPVHWQFGQLDQHPSDGYVLTDFSIISQTK